MSATPVRRRGRWRNAVATVLVLVPVVAFVVWSSFSVGAVDCEVCIRYGGREICRTVTSPSEEEGIRAATDNACALLASGVTETLRCTRTTPTRASCRPRGTGDVTRETSP